ncbi:hypothetical protein LAD77_25195 [Klebsiella pneumoniae]|nr:hypothetical protein [Klebsiella pneumoniae]
MDKVLLLQLAVSLWAIPMGNYYYVNKNAQSNGDHEVHVSSCARLPAVENRLFLGYLNRVHQLCAKPRKPTRNQMAVIIAVMRVIRPDN